MSAGREIYGLDAAPLPDNYTPVEAVAIVKCLDERGEVTVIYRRTDGLYVWDTVGMMTVALEVAKSYAVGGFGPQDEDGNDLDDKDGTE